MDKKQENEWSHCLDDFIGVTLKAWESGDLSDEVCEIMLGNVRFGNKASR